MNGPSKICGRLPLKICGRLPLSRPYHFKFFKCSLPQILLGPFLNTVSHINQSVMNFATKINAVLDINNKPF